LTWPNRRRGAARRRGQRRHIDRAADLRIATERHDHVRGHRSLGDYGGSWLLTQLVGVARAKGCIHEPSRRRAEGLALSIFNESVPDDQLMARARGPRQIDRSRPADCAEIHEREPQPRHRWQRPAQCARAQRIAWSAARTEDHREAVQAFMANANPRSEEMIMAINVDFFRFRGPMHTSHLRFSASSAHRREIQNTPVLLGGVFATNNVSPAVSLQGIKNSAVHATRNAAFSEGTRHHELRADPFFR
jgi:hypothetical protein